MNMIPIYMIVSLSCTIIIELTVALLLKIKDNYDLLDVCLVNLLTNPVLVFTTFYIGTYYHRFYRISITIFEVLVVLIEGLIYKNELAYKKINPFILSLILNASSYFLGCVINNILW